VTAGTTFLVSPSFSKWEGYVVQSDGSAARITSDFAKGLVKGTDFTSDCADDAKLSAFTNPYVVLTRSTLYAKQDLTGATCVLDPGTTLTQYSFMSTGDTAQISSDEIQAKCGFSIAYSKDFHAQTLIAK
jgi:hypothetical protein